MKKSHSTPAILAAMTTVTGCVPMVPVEQVSQDGDDDEICRMESSMGSHVKVVYESISSINRRLPHMIESTNFLIERGVLQVHDDLIGLALPKADVKELLRKQ